MIIPIGKCVLLPFICCFRNTEINVDRTINMQFQANYIIQLIGFIRLCMVYVSAELVSLFLLLSFIVQVLQN